MRTSLLIALLALPAGCTSNPLDNGHAVVTADLAVDAGTADFSAPADIATGVSDLATSTDLAPGADLLAPSTPDLSPGAANPDLAIADLAPAPPPPDLQPSADLLPGSDAGSTGGCNSVGSYTQKRVVNRFLVPPQRTYYAIDLDADGRPDNQYGNIESAFTAEQFSDDQATADAFVASGVHLMLLALDSFDPAFMNDSCAQIRVYYGSPQGGGPPDFGGSGKFAVSSSYPVATFRGELAGGKFVAVSPLAPQPPTILPIDLFFGGATLGLSITAAFLEVGPSVSGTYAELDGALRETDIQLAMVPNLALWWTSEVQEIPPTAHDMQLAAILDTGGTVSPACAGLGCQNPDGSCARSGDKKIDTCEVSTNALMEQILAPDIQLFAADGSYHPTPNGSTRDSLSLGLGFTVVGAQF